jgi:hypothetical protein
VSRKENNVQAGFEEYVNAQKEAVEHALSAYIPPEVYRQPLSPEYIAARVKGPPLEVFLTEGY